MLALGANWGAGQGGLRANAVFVSGRGCLWSRQLSRIGGALRVNSFINNMGGATSESSDWRLGTGLHPAGSSACRHLCLCAFSGLRGHAGNISKCTGVGPHIAKVLARAIRPEVDGGASSLALLPTQGAAYASRHV